MKRRAVEIQQLISVDDRVYPELQGGPRNAFGFAREVASEVRLHRSLGGVCGIPLRAWDPVAVAVASLNYRAWRARHAADIGMGEGPGLL